VKTPPPQRAAGRRALKAKGQTLPGTTSFPTPNVAYWHKAVQSVGRVPAGKRPALASYLKKRAKQLGIAGAVKGTWLEKSPAKAMANDTEAIDLSTTTRRQPLIRGAADVQMRRAGPGTVTVQHKSTGIKVGTLAGASNGGWQATHASGKKTPGSGSMQGALAGLIQFHNQQARAKLPPAQQDGTAVMPGAKSYANGEQGTLDLAGALPHSTAASSASDGPRVTAMGSGKKATTKAAPVLKMSAQGMAPEVAKVYAKLIKKGLSPKAAAAMAKRAAAMHAKATAKAA
jgi:hypothetical protein